MDFMMDTADETRAVAPQSQEVDRGFDVALRPQCLNEFLGQEKIKNNLNVFLGAARQRDEPCEHMLFYGPPGLGKTSLAHVIAHEMKASIKVTSGPALERVGDLAAILTNLQDGDILFVDEIHRMNRSIEEVLYPAMEDFALDIVIGKGPTARTLRLDLKHFTMIGATTRLSLLSSPLRDRFGVTYHLDFYSPSEMQQILQRSAKLLGLTTDDEALELIAHRARRTPRIGNRLLKRARDYAQVKADGVLTKALVAAALEALDIDARGLDEADRRILRVLIEKYQGGPVGIATLAAATAEEVETVEEVIEPFLMQEGMIARTPRGRLACDDAYIHLGLTPPQRQIQSAATLITAPG